MNNFIKISLGVLTLGAIYLLLKKRGKNKIPIKPIKNTNTTNNSNLQPPTTSTGANLPIQIGGINFANQNQIQYNLDLQKVLEEQWKKLQQLQGQANAPYFGQEIENMIANQANTAWQQSQTQYDNQTEFLNQVVNSFFDGNPLNLQHSYYHKPDGSLGLYIHSQGTPNCPAGYEFDEATKYCEWIPS